MYHRPVDHINYLQECLEKINRKGISSVRWDLFLEAKETVKEALLARRGMSLN